MKLHLKMAADFKRMMSLKNTLILIACIAISSPAFVNAADTPSKEKWQLIEKILDHYAEQQGRMLRASAAGNKELVAELQMTLEHAKKALESQMEGLSEADLLKARKMLGRAFSKRL